MIYHTNFFLVIRFGSWSSVDPLAHFTKFCKMFLWQQIVIHVYNTPMVCHYDGYHWQSTIISNHQHGTRESEYTNMPNMRCVQVFFIEISCFQCRHHKHTLTYTLMITRLQFINIKKSSPDEVWCFEGLPEKLGPSFRILWRTTKISSRMKY